MFNQVYQRKMQEHKLIDTTHVGFCVLSLVFVFDGPSFLAFQEVASILVEFQLCDNDFGGMNPNRESGPTSFLAVDVLEVDDISTTIHLEYFGVAVLEFAAHDLDLVVLADRHGFHPIFVFELHRKVRAHYLSSDRRWGAEVGLAAFPS